MLPLHIISFGFVLGVSALADKDAFSWMRGIQTTLDHKRLRTYHSLVWIGLIALIVSGFVMFYPMRASLLGDLLFDIKLVFVLILCVNALLIGRLTQVATLRPFASLSPRDRNALIASGAISVFGWACATAIAFYMFG